jgi:hypothetical protein
VADELNDIMRALGRVEAGQERMRADFDEEKEHTRESRERTYRKLEKIEQDVTIVGKVAAQARDKVDEVEKLVLTDVKPATDDFKRMRTVGFVGISLLGFAFTALGITLATVGEGVVTTIRAWLRIH